MTAPTGDYLVEFFDALGAPMESGGISAATLADVRCKADGYLPLVKAARWRILRVVAQSGDKNRWEGEDGLA